MTKTSKTEVSSNAFTSFFTDGEKRFTNSQLVSILILGASAACLAGVIFSKAPATPKTVPPHISSKIEKSFPKTSFVDFNQTDFGLIEGVTSGNIIYFDQNGDHAFIGEVLDIVHKNPITTNRKKNLSKYGNLDSIGSDALGVAGPKGATAAIGSGLATAAAPRAKPKNISMAGFPEANYVTHNKGAGPVLYLISDYNCIHCKNLNMTFRDVKDIEIREVPVTFMSADSGIFGSHSLCAEDGAQVANDLFDGKRENITTCDAGDQSMIENTEWAQANGITGTPTLISEEGVVYSGQRTPSLIRSFLGS